MGVDMICAMKWRGAMTSDDESRPGRSYRAHASRESNASRRSPLSLYHFGAR